MGYKLVTFHCLCLDRAWTARRWVQAQCGTFSVPLCRFHLSISVAPRQSLFHQSLHIHIGWPVRPACSVETSYDLYVQLMSIKVTDVQNCRQNLLRKATVILPKHTTGSTEYSPWELIILKIVHKFLAFCWRRSFSTVSSITPLYSCLQPVEFSPQLPTQFP
jgi:hypothetical protein